MPSWHYGLSIGAAVMPQAIITECFRSNAIIPWRRILVSGVLRGIRKAKTSTDQTSRTIGAANTKTRINVLKDGRRKLCQRMQSIKSAAYNDLPTLRIVSLDNVKRDYKDS
jgi:hypothetical protein